MGIHMVMWMDILHPSWSKSPINLLDWCSLPVNVSRAAPERSNWPAILFTIGVFDLLLINMAYERILLKCSLGFFVSSIEDPVEILSATQLVYIIFSSLIN